MAENQSIPIPDISQLREVGLDEANQLLAYGWVLLAVLKKRDEGEYAVYVVGERR